jgi:hypothetical protein
MRKLGDLMTHVESPEGLMPCKQSSMPIGVGF